VIGASVNGCELNDYELNDYERERLRAGAPAPAIAAR
jgi:hypothetical protein